MTNRSLTRSSLPVVVLVGLITLMASAPIAEAGSRSRCGTYAHSRSHHYSTNYRSCGSRHSYHRGHRSYGHRHHGHHRSYSSYKPRSTFSIRIGSGYRDRCYDYGYGRRYTYHRPINRTVYRTNTVYVPVYSNDYRSYDTRPVTGSVYTTSSADRYRDWQRTERVTERPTEPLLPAPAADDRFEENLREARELLGTNEEPPIGSGSTPTSGVEEFVETTPDELTRAWNALLDGDASLSRTLFADAARSTPKKGEARLGYVIASLRDNDRRAAAVSMVRLLESEPQLVRGGALPRSETLQRELARQGETLKAFRDEQVKSFENRMLIAFVALLRGDTVEAQEAMRRARSAGAEGIAARNLWRLVGLSDKPLERLSGH